MIILETVAICLMNTKIYCQLNQSHSYIHFLFSPPNPQGKEDKNTAEGQLKLSSVCQCRKRDICW